MDPVGGDQDGLEFFSIDLDDPRLNAGSHADVLDEPVGTRSLLPAGQYRDDVVPRQLLRVTRSGEPVNPAVAGVDADHASLAADHHRGECRATESPERLVHRIVRGQRRPSQAIASRLTRPANDPGDEHADGDDGSLVSR